MKALSIQHLTKTYANGVNAINDISFDVEPGDFFALLGPNGAGKSTTIGIITSLVNKSSGKVSVFDHDIDEDFAAAKRCLGLVPQEFNAGIFEKCIDILTNQAGYYGIGKAQALESAEYFLKKLDLWEKREHTPRELSGGMKRRLMIARALIHHPKLLILDEPTAGVDIEIRHAMWEFIREINQSGTTVILTTHYLEEAENLCRNIAIIDHGRIIEHSSMNQLLRKLNTETFLLNLDQSLRFTPELDGFKCHLLDENTIEVDVDKSQNMNQLFTQLNEQNIAVTSMRNKANRLETLFLGLIKQGQEK